MPPCRCCELNLARSSARAVSLAPNDSLLEACGVCVCVKSDFYSKVVVLLSVYLLTAGACVVDNLQNCSLLPCVILRGNQVDRLCALPTEPSHLPWLSFLI